MPAASQKAIKAFFKLVSLDLAPKLKAELDQGFDLEARFDETGHGATTPLIYAVGHGKDACARVLVDAGADVKAKGDHGDTALHHVTAAALASELIERGADVDAKTTTNRTPLHEACARNDREVVGVLLQHGAHVDGKDKQGITPYAAARDAEIRALLRQHGAKGFGDGGGKMLRPKKRRVELADIEIEDKALGVDREGNVWMAGHEGIYCHAGKAVTCFEFEESFSVDQIEPGPPGVVYFATNWGLLQHAGGKFKLYSSEDSELFDHHLVYLRTAPDGRAYMVSYEDEAEAKHVSVFDGTAFTLLAPGKDLPAMAIECLGFDGAGELVIGGAGGFAMRRAGAWKVVEKLGRDHTDPHVYDIAGKGDALWLATESGVYEYRDDKAKKYATADLATCLALDGDVVWIGLSYGGLGRLANGKLTVQKQAGSALPGDDVARLVRGPDGTIWIGAESQVARIVNGKLERVTGEPAEPAEPERELLPWPTAPIVARAKLPKPVLAAIEGAGVTGVDAKQLAALVRPAIAFDCVKYKTVDVGASKFGGQPDLPPKLAWPAFADDADAMIPFVMQFDLAEVHAHDKEQLLPATGMLYFFADTSPDELRGARVLYADVARAKLARRAFPEDLVDRANERDFVAQLPEYKIELAPVHTLPSRGYLHARANLAATDDDALAKLRAALVKLGNKKLPAECSRLLGWPDSVQGDVVTDAATIALLQLNGYELSPKGVEKIFEHWCSDGLIHFVIDAKSLAKKQLDRAEASMAYT